IATLIALSSILGAIFQDNSESIYVIFSWIFVLYVMLNYFNIVFYLSNQRETSSLKRRRNIKKRNLSQWLGEISYDDVSIHSWLESEESDVVNNLKEIKRLIKEKVGDNIYDFYLLKSYLEYHSKNN